MQNVAVVGSGDVAKAAIVKLLKVMPELTVYLVARNPVSMKNITDSCATMGLPLQVLQIDIMSQTEQVVAEFKSRNIDCMLNLGSPYIDLVAMDICLAAGCHYLDTACYEEFGTKGFSYKQQWAYQDKFAEAGLCAILGAGGSPGVTNMLAKRTKEDLGSLAHLEIFDGNAGGQDKYRFATNFSPEDNIKELDNPATHWDPSDARNEDGWVRTAPFSEKKNLANDPLNYYRIYHEELETLVHHNPEIKTACNYMSFGDDYLNCFAVLRDVGMFGMDDIEIKGVKIKPIEFIAKVLPKPADVAAITTGEAFMTVVGEDEAGKQSAYRWEMNHEECFADTNTGAVAWSTGVPAILFAQYLHSQPAGVWNVEQLDTTRAFELLEKFDVKIRAL